MKASYRLNKSLSLKLALLPLMLLFLTVLGTVLALIGQLNWHFFKQVLFDHELHFALMLSLGTSLFSLVVALLIALPAAWVMSQIRLPLQKLIDTVLDLPMVLPPLVTGLSLLLLFGSQGWLSSLIPEISRWIFSPIGIVVAQSYIATSIMLRNARGVFSHFDDGYRLAAYNLGLTPWQSLLKVELPMCWKPLLCGAILAWARAIGEFGATLMLAGATRFKTETLPVSVYLNISSGDFQPVYFFYYVCLIGNFKMLQIQHLQVGILKDISLTVANGESVAIVGQSGSGKTTLLNAIAGYSDYQGSIAFNQCPWDNLASWERRCRYLNQRLYLFPHKTVSGNLSLAKPKSTRQEQLDLLAQLNIDALIDRYPHQLSGGEQQRAALARALINPPDVMLLDEPFSSLDWQTRQQIWQNVKSLLKTFNLTTLLVTHEPKEADLLADRQIHLHLGRLI